jgi:hypothetical protein
MALDPFFLEAISLFLVAVLLEENAEINYQLSTLMNFVPMNVQIMENA